MCTNIEKNVYVAISAVLIKLNKAHSLHVEVCRVSMLLHMLFMWPVKVESKLSHFGISDHLLMHISIINDKEVCVTRLKCTDVTKKYFLYIFY